MVVVADTTPLNYLVLIGEVDILYVLFGTVILPKAVFAELTDRDSPLKVRSWAAQLPPWVEVRVAPPITSPALGCLDPGEREAIQLTLDFGLPIVLMDEMKGRRVARTLGLKVRGTLGLLEDAARLGKVNFREAVARLELTNFYVTPTIKNNFLARNPGR